ncbi:Fc.00g024200.m01.CDS01 [Cosmosporella sp. VM-42]
MSVKRDDIIFTREVPKHLVLDPTRFDVALAQIYGIGKFDYELKGNNYVVTVNVPAPFDLKKELQGIGGCIFESDQPLPGETTADSKGKGSSTEKKT